MTEQEFDNYGFSNKDIIVVKSGDMTGEYRIQSVDFESGELAYFDSESNLNWVDYQEVEIYKKPKK